MATTRHVPLLPVLLSALVFLLQSSSTNALALGNFIPLPIPSALNKIIHLPIDYSLPSQLRKVPENKIGRSGIDTNETVDATITSNHANAAVVNLGSSSSAASSASASNSASSIPATYIESVSPQQTALPYDHDNNNITSTQVSTSGLSAQYPEAPYMNITIARNNLPYGSLWKPGTSAYIDVQTAFNTTMIFQGWDPQDKRFLYAGVDLPHHDVFAFVIYDDWYRVNAGRYSTCGSSFAPVDAYGAPNSTASSSSAKASTSASSNPYLSTLNPNSMSSAYANFTSSTSNLNSNNTVASNPHWNVTNGPSNPPFPLNQWVSCTPSTFQWSITRWNNRADFSFQVQHIVAFPPPFNGGVDGPGGAKGNGTVIRTKLSAEVGYQCDFRNPPCNPVYFGLPVANVSNDGVVGLGASDALVKVADVPPGY